MDPEKNTKQSDSCGQCTPAGPTREKGGTTGEGNLTPGGANRTGGATSGIDERYCLLAAFHFVHYIIVRPYAQHDRC